MRRRLLCGGAAQPARLRARFLSAPYQQCCASEMSTRITCSLVDSSVSFADTSTIDRSVSFADKSVVVSSSVSLEIVAVSNGV